MLVYHYNILIYCSDRGKKTLGRARVLCRVSADYSWIGFFSRLDQRDFPKRKIEIMPVLDYHSPMDGEKSRLPKVVFDKAVTFLVAGFG